MTDSMSNGPLFEGLAQVTRRLRFRKNPLRSTTIRVGKGWDVLDDRMESELIIRS